MKNIWDFLDIEDYLKIKDGDIELLTNLVINNSKTEEEADELLLSIKTKPESKNIKININSKQFVNFMYYMKDIDGSIPEILEEYKLKGLAKDCLEFIENLVEKIYKILDTFSIIFKDDDDEDENKPEFDNTSFSENFGWYALLESVCKTFNISLLDLYNIDCEDFLLYVVYIKEKNKYDASRIEQYKKQ